MKTGTPSGQGKYHIQAEINMIPFIDVALVLLIIFMVISPILVESQMRVNLPKVKESGKAERTALNFIQRLSGIATLTHTYVARLKNTHVRVVDTRKTTPGWRTLEKYAVKIGGGSNHRMGLYDGVLIKDNHIAACGGILAAVTRARKEVHHLVKIEVEVTNPDELTEALSAGVDVIMLDNMTPEQIRKAVKQINGQVLVEVSGNVTLDNLSQLAEAGVDFISVGALTHSAKSADMSMKIRKE